MENKIKSIEIEGQDFRVVNNVIIGYKNDWASLERFCCHNNSYQYLIV